MKSKAHVCPQGGPKKHNKPNTREGDAGNGIRKQKKKNYGKGEKKHDIPEENLKRNTGKNRLNKEKKRDPAQQKGAAKNRTN